VEDDSSNVSAPAQVMLVVLDTQAPTAVVTVTDEGGRALPNNSISFGQGFVLNGKRSVDLGGDKIVKYTWTLLN